jgi:hypothetical protein
MTVKAINQKFEIEAVVHETARQIVELIQAAKERAAKLGGDEDDTEQRIIELATEE